MKRLFIILFAAAALFACNSKTTKKSDKIDKLTPQTSIDWMGTYESDSVKIKFKDDGVCKVTTPSEKLNGDYSWDVDGTTICVVDENKNIYWLQVHDGYLITADTNKKFIKVK